jgi:hypothetical protein
VTGLSEPLDERWRRVGAVDPQRTMFEVLQFPTRSAPELQHLAVRHVRDDMLQEDGDGFCYACWASP